jgi:flagellar basal-body rod protein FlgF
VLRGLYSAASGMLAQQVQTDNLADNLANVNTTGFKRRSTQFQSFPVLMMNRLGGGDPSKLGTLATGSQVKGTPIHFQQGSLRQTGNPFDVAIQGDGFFQVKGPGEKVFYTRNGQFQPNAKGVLTTTEGFALLDASGNEITVPANANRAVLTKAGSLQVPGQGEIARIGLAVFEDRHVLQKAGQHLYEAPDNQPPEIRQAGTTEGGGILEQGSLEQSNVQVLGEMVQMITSQRLYEALQKAIQTQNGTLGKVINDLK